jgi:3-oxoacyl-[acyl-carrier-protein] synthase-3
MRPVIIGTGSFLPPTKYSLEEFIELAQLKGRGGAEKKVLARWAQLHLGIREKRYDFQLDEFGKPGKKSRQDGGLYDGDLKVRAVRSACMDAGIEPQEIDVMIDVSCTPDLLYCQEGHRFTALELGLAPEAAYEVYNLGCGGLAKGWEQVLANAIVRGPGTIIVLVASACPSGEMNSKEVFDWYNAKADEDATLVPLIFGDGAGAVVLRVQEGGKQGVLVASSRYDHTKELIRHPTGNLYVPTKHSLGSHMFWMDGLGVKQAFVPFMQLNVEQLTADWNRYIQPVVGGEFSRDRVAAWLLHQANGNLLTEAANMLQVPLERVLRNIDRYGNTAAASTLILLDEARRNGTLKEGDEVAMAWIGAGAGLQHGYTYMVL